MITAVHPFKFTDEVSRNSKSRTLPLNDTASLALRLSSHKDAHFLLRVVNHLDVENSLRYAPEKGRTFCNIYALDFAYICGILLPRHFTQDRINLAVAEDHPSSSALEASSNRIGEWLRSHNGIHQWQEIPSIERLQELANSGYCALVVAEADHGHGHICAIVPESTRQRASRDLSGQLTTAIQSQAGNSNFEVRAAALWWLSPAFSRFTFWAAKPVEWPLSIERPAIGLRGLARLTSLILPTPTRELIAHILHCKEANSLCVQPSSKLITALIVAEDRRFMSHRGFDARAIIRAVFYSIVLKKPQGGSTIEQQLVRTITKRKEYTIRRKLREILLATILGYILDKPEVASIYLRMAYFGWRMNGVEQAASRLQIDLFHITNRQAAELVSAIRNPLPQHPTERQILAWTRKANFVERLLDGNI